MNIVYRSFYVWQIMLKYLRGERVESPVALALVRCYMHPLALHILGLSGNRHSNGSCDVVSAPCIYQNQGNNQGVHTV